MTIYPNQPDWKQYEDFVYQTLMRKYPDHVFERDVQVVGRVTEKERQIDIAIRGDFLGHDLFVVVDCKYHSRNIDVKTVESFIGFLEDVGADFGILVTNRGYSEAAFKRAQMSHIKLDIVEFDRVAEYEIEFDFCQECDPGEDHPPGIIEWCDPVGVEGDVDKVLAIGRCDWCNTLHVQCQRCGTITGIPEMFYGDPVECLGGCGNFFLVEYVYAGEGLFKERLTWIPKDEQHHKQRTA
jgi:hypothetical protein